MVWEIEGNLGDGSKAVGSYQSPLAPSAVNWGLALANLLDPSNGFFFLLLDHKHVIFSSYVWIIYSNKETEINWF